jgi:FAD linked oxidases, C-terminal domain
LLEDVVSLTAKLGGTLTGEHGDGRIRTPLLSRVWHKDAIRAFALVKKAFDPRNILNPGVKVPLPNQKAIGDIKYDPALPPLPAEARAALDDVVKARAYNRLRLSLIGRSS